MVKSESEMVDIKEEPVVDHEKESGMVNGGEIFENDFDQYFEHSSPSNSLPLEVITDENCHIPQPPLKYMSNGALTQRNIFTEEERSIFRQIMEKYRSIVDARSRTREVYLEKQVVWHQIVEEYNSTENISNRTEKELKKCWDNMKYRAKLAEREINHHSLIDTHSIFSNAITSSLRAAAMCPSNQQELIHNFHEVFDSSNENDAVYAPINHQSSENGHKVEDEDELEDEQPALKKARQESPKLTSILLGDAKKDSFYPKESNKGSVSPPTKFPENKNHHSKGNSSNPVAVFSKDILEHCEASIRKNFHPYTINLDPSDSINRPKNGLQDGNGICATTNVIFSQSENNSSHNSESNNSPGSYSSSQKHLPRIPPRNSGVHSPVLQPTDGATSVNKQSSDAEKSELEKELLLQRLLFEKREHELKMRVLQMQLETFAKESEFWSLKKEKFRETAHNN